jgi:hypothetical protein
MNEKGGSSIRKRRMTFTFTRTQCILSYSQKKSPQEFREEIKEMKDELDKLSQSIEQTVLGLDTIIAEKLKLEIKLKNIQAKFTEKKKQNQTSSCTVC